jgi:hypothetical protein
MKKYARKTSVGYARTRVAYFSEELNKDIEVVADFLECSISDVIRTGTIHYVQSIIKNNNLNKEEIKNG